MTKERDTVILTRDLAVPGLRAGDVGTVVLVHRDGEAFEVEFVAFDGRTIALERLRPADIRPSTRYCTHGPSPESRAFRAPQDS